jgi:hypothetical protein
MLNATVIRPMLSSNGEYLCKVVDTGVMWWILG